MVEKKEIGLIGFGNFGRFILPYLKKYFTVSIYDVSDYSSEATNAGAEWASLQTVCAKEIVILGVPVQFLEHTLVQIKGYFTPGALVLDISSVKVKPIALMEKYLPHNVQIVGTHPLFGPQSGKNGIKGLNLVVCPVRSNAINSIIRFCSRELQLNVLERTPVVHDQQMAYVQALTHFIGRAVNDMDIPDVEQKTVAYQYLLDIKKGLGKDSIDLFYTIEKENPFAKEVREQFMGKLLALNNLLAE